MHIDIATPADIPALCTLLAELFSQEAEFTSDPEAQARGLGKIITDPSVGVVLVAKEGGAAIGMVNLLYTVSTALGEKVALLEDMIVTAQARGTGIGSQILERAIAMAHSNECKRITLLTDRSNNAAQRFYKKQGFDISTMIPLRLSIGSAPI